MCRRGVCVCGGAPSVGVGRGHTGLALPLWGQLLGLQSPQRSRGQSVLLTFFNLVVTPPAPSSLLSTWRPC